MLGEYGFGFGAMTPGPFPGITTILRWIFENCHRYYDPPEGRSLQFHPMLQEPELITGRVSEQ